MSGDCEECGEHAVDCECEPEPQYVSKEEWDAICGINESLCGSADGYIDPKSKARYDAVMKDVMKNIMPMEI